MNQMPQIAADTASPFKARYDNFIGGTFVAPVNGRYFSNITPISGLPSVTLRVPTRPMSSWRSTPPMPPRTAGATRRLPSAPTSC